MIKRIVCHFSCGAASAVATKMIIEENKRAASPLPLVVIRCYVADEHPDNSRFAADCEQWFGVAITTLRDTKYGASIDTVFRRERFINSKNGAPCTRHLKRGISKAFAQAGDLDIFGFNAGEEDRLDRMIDANNEMRVRAPLIESKLDKGACMAILLRAGIQIPYMYIFGYDHNNCIGCAKAGAWYWNKIRVDFPEVFARRMTTEELIGHPMLRINGKGVWLRDLDPKRGRKHEEPVVECGVACELVERTL